jgi:hypothetical protein
MVAPYNYGPIRATATRLLQRFGFNAKLRRRAASNGWEPGATVTDVAITAVFDNYKTIERDGTLIQQGDRRIYFTAPSSITPNAGDQIVVGADDPYSVVSVEAIEPGAVVLLYVAQVRR